MKREPGFHLGRFFGVDVHARGGWLMALGLLSALLGQNFFAPFFPAAESGVYVMGLLGALLIYACILAHELGHALVARDVFGGRSISITLHFFHASANMREEPPGPAADFWVTLAGPMANLLLAAIFYALLRSSSPDLLFALSQGTATALDPAPDVTELLFALLFWANAILGVFNLAPLYPWDGGRVAVAALWAATGSLTRATRWATTWSRLIFFAMAGLGAGLAWQNWPEFWFEGLWLFFIGLFFNGMAKRAQSGVELREGLRGLTAESMMSDDPAPLSGALSLEAAEAEFIRLEQQFMPVVDAEGVYLGMIAKRQFNGVPRDRWSSTTLEGMILGFPEGARLLYQFLTVEPAAKGLDVFHRLFSNPFGKLPVLRGRRLVGVVTRKKLVELLRAKGVALKG
jgi:Zn-dependent protease